jgi:hypothetical protein
MLDSVIISIKLFTLGCSSYSWITLNSLTVSARGVVGLWKRAMDQQQQVQPQQQQPVERWREYYYAPANKVGSDVYIAAYCIVEHVYCAWNLAVVAGLMVSWAAADYDCRLIVLSAASLLRPLSRSSPQLAHVSMQ